MAGITLSDLTFDPLKNVDLSTRLDTDQPSVGEAMQARPVGAAVRAAHGLNTDTVARHNALAQKMQLPMGTVRRKFSEAQQQDMIRRIEARPELAAFASTSPERAALYIDDPDAWDVVWERVVNMPEAIGQAWDIGKHNQQFAALGREFMDAPEGKLQEVRTRMAAHLKERQAFIPVDSYADEVALTTAAEQMPRMAEMLPRQAGAAALAGLGGAVAGSVVPVLGTTSAAVASARAGWLAATAYTAFEAERDSAVADFALLQDEEGQHMSREDVVGAATIYAAGAAAIETAGEAFFLSLAKPFLGSLAKKITPKAFLKTAVQRAMQNKSTRAAVLDIAKRVGQNALGEGGEESLQGLLQDVMQVVAMAKSDEHGNTNFGEQTVFKTETVKNIVENFGAGFGAGLWLGGVPMITLGAQDVVAAHRAGLWADEQKKLHAEVEATKVKAASPELTQAMLEEGPRLEGNAVIPADALMELHQQDTLILPALGMEEKAVQQAADMGQELTVPLARLHASLDQTQANAVLDIAREEPQSMNAAEARRLTDRLRTMGERAIAETAGRTEELRARDIEVERLREEMTRAVDSVPGLRARLESGEGLQGEAGGVAQFVEDNLRVAVGMARYLADETGRPLAEFLRPITYEGLDVNSRGQLVPMYKIREEMESEEERARAEADRPFWELVWGRVDPESLKTDYAETYKQLRKEKRGLFMPAGRGGVPLDQIADELNERGIFTGSADDLLELLKTKERPRRGYYQEGELTEQEEKAEAAQRVQAWLSEENLAQAKDLDRGAIFEIFGNELEAVAVLPEHLLALFSDEVLDTRVYSGMGYFIDHAVNNHPEVAPELYAESIQSTLDNYTDVYVDESTDSSTGKKRNSLVFMQDLGEGKKNVVTLAEDDAGRIILYKNFYQSKRNPSKKLRRVEPPVGGPTTISHAETSARQRPLSALGDNASIAQGGEDVNSLEQRAFHGSPHRFMKFMLEHIGSGEGAQAHGWGLYFAQGRETAEGYRERLTRENRKFTVGKEHFQRNAAGQFLQADGAVAPEYVQAALRFIDGASSVQEGLANMAEFLKQMKKLPDGMFSPEVLQSVQEGKKWLAKKQISIETPEGQVYELDIPENDVLLDEQATFADQPEFVQAGVLAAFAKLTDEQVARVKQEMKAELRLEAPELEILELEIKKDEIKALARALSFVSKNKERPAHNSPFTGGAVYDASMRRLGAIYSSEEVQALQSDDAAAQEELAKVENQIADLERILAEDKKRREANREQRRRSIDTNSILEALPGMKGEDIYSKLTVAYGSSKAASAALNDMGVKGITYDGQSDGRCFVIFDDQAIDMLDSFYQFIGEEGAARLDEAEEASTRLDDLDVARQMEEAGKDAAAIKMATGWERGADGKWRYEIDDSYASMNILYPDMQGPLASSLLSDQQADELAEKLDIARRVQANPEATMTELFGEDGPKVQRMLFDLGNLDQFVRQTEALLEGGDLTLGAILDHEELFTAYPRLRDVQVNIIDDGQSSHGSYSRSTNLITLNKAALDDAPLLMHEVQHAIQDREGFASGGNKQSARFLASRPLRELLEIVGFEAETYERNAEELAAIEFGLDRIRFTEQPKQFEKTGEYLRVKPFAMPKDKKERAEVLTELVSGWIQERSAEFRSLGHGWWAENADKQELLERRKKLQAENKKLAQSSKDAARATRLLDKLDEMSDYDIYHALAGEVEARNTQRRMGMTYEERLASLASSTEDVARKDQIFLRDALGRAMAMGEGRAKGVTRGETVFTPTAMGMDYVVRLFKHANLSTLAHESSHVFFLQMKQLVDEGQASPRMQADYAALCRWVGSKDGYLNRDQHEKLAKGMELFLREGKAPSKKLEGAFGRFRRWLTEVYKAITGPYFQDEQGRQITLNPEVREVFSRILATQEEVARQAADEVIGRDFTAELDKLGVTGAQRVAITGLVKEAKDLAETRLHEAREAGRKAMQAKWKKEAEAQVAEERIYKARKAMRNSGMNMLALASAVGNEAAGEFFRKLPGIKREGANPWAFAASFGYDSVDQMMQEMLSTPSKAERVEQLVAQKQAEHDKQFKAQSLIASDQAAAMEEMVQEHIINAMGGKERGVALAQIKQAAREYLAGLPMDDAINSGKFRYQAIRLMHMEREAIMAQDYGRAMDINFKLRLNMELTRQSQELRDKTHGLARKAAQFCASKIHTPVCRYAVAFLGVKAGLMPSTKMIMRTAQDKDLTMVEAWAAEATDYGYTFKMDGELWYADINPWRHMSLSYFDRVYRQLTQIMTIEQNMRTVEAEQERVELSALSGQIESHILAKNPERQSMGVHGDEDWLYHTKNFIDSMTQVRTVAKLMDDDEPLGLIQDLLIRPFDEAENRKLAMSEKLYERVSGIFARYLSRKELVAMKDKVFDKNLNQSISMEARILILLNLGNSGNKNRLMAGFKHKDMLEFRNWTEREVNLAIAPLEKRHYDLAQELWDLFESLKKERFDQEEALTGVRPIEVEAVPLRTPYGIYRGGYFPIKYDPRRGAEAAAIDKSGPARLLLPTVAHGAMKERQAEGLGTPLDLRFSVITDALAESIHDVTYRKPVIEVAKILRQRNVRDAIMATWGARTYAKMWHWVHDIAGEKPAAHVFDKAASWARTNLAVYTMAIKITTILSQVTALATTITELGPYYSMRGVARSVTEANEGWKFICANSVMMKNRLTNFDRDVRALTNDLTAAGHSSPFLDKTFQLNAWVKQNGFKPMGYVQLWFGDIPTWKGAYLKATEQFGWEHKKAVRYADDMVITTQGSGATKDLADIMRKPGMAQLLTVYYGFFNVLYNLWYKHSKQFRRHKDLPHVLHLATMALVFWVAEPMISGIIARRGPDDEDEWKKWALYELARQPFQMIAGVRDMADMFFNKLEGKYGRGYEFSPALDVVAALPKSLYDAGQLVLSDDYEEAKKHTKRLAKDIGMLSGTPLLGAQMQTTLGNMWDWLDGSEEFNLRDLFFTRKK